MRLPDPHRSRAVLVGVGAYQSPELADLPAVGNNLRDLTRVLTGQAPGGLVPDRCEQILDPTDLRAVYRTIRDRANEATDTFLLYYAGHGQVGERSEFYLTLADTNLDELSITALDYDLIRRLLVTSRAAHTVVILDSCFSGRAVPTMSGDTLTGLVDIGGTYVLASAPPNSMALAPVGARYTAFTGELLNVLRSGLPDGPELLTFTAIYRQLLTATAAARLPSPVQMGTGTSDSLALARNPAYTPPPPPPPPPPPLPAPPAPPPPASAPPTAPPLDVPPDLHEALENLQAYVRDVCAERLRDVDGPDALPVRWTSTQDGDTARDAHGLAVFYTRPESPRRLVVLGAPGSGTTTLAHRLCADLMESVFRTGPVPLPVRATEWDPRTHRLAAWCVERIAHDVPDLTAAIAARLYEAGAVVPVLDGLDELPDALRHLAVADLNRRRGTPVVVTCRTGDYPPDGLRWADVVTVRPLEVDDVADHLHRARPRAWTAVIEHIRADPAGPLASALRTPVMTRLARALHTPAPPRGPFVLALPTGSPSPRPPDDLLRLPDRVAIDNHLARALPAVAYPDPPAAIDRWPADAARGWLEVLRRHIDDGRGRTGHTISWWELRLLVRPLFAVLSGLLIAVPAMVNAPGDPVSGLVTALIGGAVFGFVASARWSGLPPSTWRPRRADLMLTGAVLAAGTTAAVLLRSADRWATDIAAFAVTGVAYLTVCWPGLWTSIGRRGLARAEHRAEAALAAGSPQSLIRTDRAWMLKILAFTAGWTAVSAALTLLSGHRWPHAGTRDDVTFVVVAFTIAGAWWRLQIARICLAATGKLPWRVTAFLDDAHRRGVLRRTGPSYEMRYYRPGQPPPPVLLTAPAPHPPRPWTTAREVLGGAGVLVGVAALVFLIVIAPIWDGRRNLQDATGYAGPGYDRSKKVPWYKGENAGLTQLQYTLSGAGVPIDATFAVGADTDRFLHIQPRIVSTTCGDGTRVAYRIVARTPGDADGRTVRTGTFTLPADARAVHTVEYAALGRSESLDVHMQLDAPAPADCQVVFALQDPYTHSLPAWLSFLASNRQP